MSDENKAASTGFNENYKVLKDTADWLSDQAEPDIDQLVPKVEKAMQAYQNCKDRLTKVQEMLSQYFDKDDAKNDASPAGTGSPGKRAARSRRMRDGDQDDNNASP
jgi:exodeoxyribonuclease VII small subunit